MGENRRGRLIAAAVLGALLLGGGFLLGRTATPADLEQAATPPATDPFTVGVVRQVVRSTVVARGSVTYDRELVVALHDIGHLDASTPAVTWLPDEGTTVAGGSVLAEVAYRPLILLPGQKPLVRDLEPGDSGPHVLVLQDALRRMGLLEEVDGRFGPVTAAAVNELYDSVSYSPPTVVGRMHVPAAEIHIASTLPMVVRSQEVNVGQLVAAGQGLIRLSSTDQLIVAGLPSFEAASLSGGEPVELIAESSSYQGVVTHVGSVPDEEAGGFPVQIEPSSRVPDDRDYRVVIELESTGESVLAVPETALYLDGDGSSYVTRWDGGQREVVAVEVGLSGSNGLVEIIHAEGSRLQAGDRVVVGGSG